VSRLAAERRSIPVRTDATPCNSALQRGASVWSRPAQRTRRSNCGTPPAGSRPVSRLCASASGEVASAVVVMRHQRGNATTGCGRWSPKRSRDATTPRSTTTAASRAHGSLFRWAKGHRRLPHLAGLDTDCAATRWSAWTGAGVVDAAL